MTIKETQDVQEVQSSKKKKKKDKTPKSENVTPEKSKKKKKKKSSKSEKSPKREKKRSKEVEEKSLENEQKSKCTSYDPFSAYGQYDDPFAIDKDDSHSDPVAPFEVEQETAIATATATLVSSVEVGSSSDCPLLQNVPTNQLPLRFQRLLDVHNTINDPETVEHLLGYVPSKGVMFLFMFLDFCGVVSVILYYTVDSSSCWDDYGTYCPTNLKEEQPVILILLVMFVVLMILYTCIWISRAKKIRAPLYAKDSRGRQKRSPGDFKGGIYLVGNTGLLEFNPNREKAWLFPLESIVSVDHIKHHGQEGNLWYEAIVKVRKSSGKTFEHKIKNGFKEKFSFNNALEDQESMGLKIKRWFERCTNNALMYPV